MHKPAVYLCGPINNRQFTAAERWRETAEQLLAPEFTVLTPLRGRGSVKEHAANAAGAYTGTATAAEFTPRELVERDLMDIRMSRAVLRFYDGASEGSPMEAFYATHVLHIPVVVVNTTSTPNEHLTVWLRHHCVRIVNSVEEAAAYLKHIWLYPGEEIEKPYDVREFAPNPHVPFGSALVTVPC